MFGINFQNILSTNKVTIPIGRTEHKLRIWRPKDMNRFPSFWALAGSPFFFLLVVSIKRKAPLERFSKPFPLTSEFGDFLGDWVEESKGLGVRSGIFNSRSILKFPDLSVRRTTRSPPSSSTTGVYWRDYVWVRKVSSKHSVSLWGALRRP